MACYEALDWAWELKHRMVADHREHINYEDHGTNATSLLSFKVCSYCLAIRLPRLTLPQAVTKAVRAFKVKFRGRESSSKVLSLAGEAIARVSAVPWHSGSGCCIVL